MNPPRSVRRTPRLQGYDYSQHGAYFITICTHRRQQLFGQISNGECQLDHVGLVAWQDWEAIPKHYSNVELDGFVVMPNHFHGIILLADSESVLPDVNPPKSPYLSQIIGGYKAGVTRKINLTGQRTIIWQRNFHDHIIRNEAELNYIRHYVANNPAVWEQDRFYGSD